MKWIRRYSSLIVVVCAAVFFAANLISSFTHKRRKGIKVEQLPSKITAERPFVILIPSYNNAKYYKKNLTSVFEQAYTNYRVIYIDDASTDGMGEKVESWLKQEGVKEKVQLIHNESRRGALENYYRAIHCCQDEEILVFLDGDDFLAHDKVLQTLNTCYQDPDTWMTYGSYVEYPTYRRSRDKEILEKIHKAHNYRSAFERVFLIPHLRTGYAGLFKQIKLADLLHEGGFLGSCQDRALMLPAIEMAKRHARCVRDVLCIYNRDNVLNDDKVNLPLQMKYRELIHALPPYPPIATWKREEPSVDIVMISKSGPMELMAALDSIEQFVTGYERIFVLGAEHAASVGKGIVVDAVEPTSGNYYLICDDEHLFNQPVDVKECAALCMEAGAEEMSFSGSCLESSISFVNDIVAGSAHVHGPVRIVSGSTFLEKKPAEFQLAYRLPRVRSLYLSGSRENLLTKFTEGLKIDLQALLQQDLSSVHETDLPLIPR